MKGVLGVLGVVALLPLAAGCDLNNVPAEAKVLLGTAKGPVPELAGGDQLQIQERLRLRDESCTNEGDMVRNRYSHAYGGSNGNGSGGGSGGGQGAGGPGR